MEMINIIILVVLVILVPIIPAFILYKSLPALTKVSGPFKGLNIQLSGSFAGYFIIVLLTTGLIVTYWETCPRYQLWTIKGIIRLSGEDIVQGVDLSIKPPNPYVDPTGGFNIKVPLEKEEVVNSAISIHKEGYSPVTISLDKEKEPHGVKLSKNTITIKEDIILQSQKNAPNYSSDQGIIPKQIQ
jgi:hypothetical protein